MSRIYLFSPDSDRYDSIMLAGPDVLEPLHALLDGRDPDPANWKFRYFKAERKGDFPSLHLLVPVLSQRAWDALMPLLGDCCRAYPLSVRRETYYALSVRRIVDCLDREKSRLEFFMGEIEAVENMTLIEERLGDAPMFRIKGIEDQGVYLSAACMKAIDEHGLKGLDKVQFWPPAGRRRPG